MSVYINISSNSDLGMYDQCNFNTNIFNDIDHGILHLEKNIDSHSIVTISSDDLNRPIFKIYSNVLDTLEHLTPKWIFRADTLTTIPDLGTVSTWTDNVIGATATGFAAPSLSLPIMKRDEVYPYVRCGAPGDTNNAGINCIKLPSWTISYPAGYTVIICCRAYSLKNYERMFGMGISGTSAVVSFIRPTTASNFSFWDTNLGMGAWGYNTNISQNIWTIMSVRAKNGTASNGSDTSYNTGTVGTSSSSSVTFPYVYINGNGNAEGTTNRAFGNIDYREFRMYDTYLSDTVMTTIINEIKAYYGM